jgi:mono/diheme cytochrome c family protein
VVLNKAIHVALSSLLLCALCTACGDGQTESNKSKTGAIETIDPGQARKLYTMKCSLCHGPDGRLMASLAPDLSTSTTSMKQREIIIKYGKGLMPPLKGLSPAEVRGLALYIENFRK